MRFLSHSSTWRAGLESVGVGVLSALIWVAWVQENVALLWTNSDLLGLFCAVALAGIVFSLGPALVFRNHVRPFWMGLATLVFLYGGEWWFRSPPPHAVQETWRGSIWIGLGLCCLWGCWLWLTRFAWFRRSHLVALVVWAVLRPIDSGPTDPVTGIGPDVVLISVDTLRADHMGPWSGGTHQTPVVERLAKNGALFENAYAPIAVTGPSHAAMLTGTEPWRAQMLLNGVPIPKSASMLSEKLQSSGYQTGGFVSAYVLDGQLGFQRGFEVFDDDFGWVRGWSRTGPGRIHSMIERHLWPTHVVERRGDFTVDQALSWMATTSNEPMFMWVHLFDPHGPYLPPAPFDTMFYSGDPRAMEHTSMEKVSGVAEYLKPSLDGIRDVNWVNAQYAGEVAFVDQQIGRIVEALELRGTLENTIVVVVGDHGESLGENGVWFNHGGDLDDSAIRVPFLIHWPDGVGAGVVVDQPVGVVDVSPTILGLLSRANEETDGTDLSPMMRGENIVRGPVWSVCYDREMNQKERAAGKIEAPTHILAKGWGPSGWFRIGTHPERGAVQIGVVDPDMHSRLPALLRSLGSGVHAKALERNDETVERLRTLGYVE